MNNKVLFHVKAAKNPCRPDCQDRSPTCHGNCERYRQYFDDTAAEREKRFRKKDADGFYYEYQRELTERLRRSGGKK